ncbi:MAG TPA: glycoside hydrolase family 16 protein [Planctomycetota bacterium]|nr:glycoside hydrolase family 16 protein [Planctomycetota bacterium]
MKHLALLLLFLPSPQSIKASSHPEDWELVWSDEFDGKEIDPMKWKYETGGHGFGNNEQQFYTDRADNSFVDGGALVIRAQAEKFENRKYTSAKLQTKAAWTYGRFEFKVKLPKGKGVWPAIWMMPSDLKKYGGWPQCGEIDILEQLGHDPNHVYGTLHFGNPHPGSGKGASVVLKQGSLVDDWHDYALEWYPGELRWFVDGELYQVQNDWFTSGGGGAPWPAPYDRDFYLQLNVAVGGGWPGNPDATTVFPQVMKVDYVRVFKSKAAPALRAKGSVKTDVPPLKAWEPKK